jgi:CO/xanthine dehydrogenase FAD-binding subunit
MNVVEHYLAPTSLDDALATLGRGEVTILAGGTDLTPQTKAGRVAFKPTLLNIRRIPELGGIAQEGGEIRIGALVTVTEIMQSDLIARHLPVLVETCRHFASDQIRNASSLGGNLCNASPAGDLSIPLLALDAQVELVSKPNGARNTRTLPLSEFFTGPGRTQRDAGELLSSVRIPLPVPGHVARFHKFGTRVGLDISTISIAIGGTRAGGVLTNVRVAFGAVAPTPIRAARTEAALEGQRLDAALIDRVGEVAHDEVKPIDDVRASAWYRKEMIRNMTKRMLDDVANA